MTALVPQIFSVDYGRVMRYAPPKDVTDFACRPWSGTPVRRRPAFPADLAVVIAGISTSPNRHRSIRHQDLEIAASGGRPSRCCDQEVDIATPRATTSDTSSSYRTRVGLVARASAIPHLDERRDGLDH